MFSYDFFLIWSLKTRLHAFNKAQEVRLGPSRPEFKTSHTRGWSATSHTSEKKIQKFNDKLNFVIDVELYNISVFS